MVWLLLVATLFLLLLLSSGAGADPPQDQQEPALFTMEFQNLPTKVCYYPTRGWSTNAKVPGTLMVENYRPDDVMVYLNVTIQCEFFSFVDPNMLIFGPTRMTMSPFNININIPPNTFGPYESTLSITAVANTGIRDIAEMHQEITVTILGGVDQMVEGLSTFFVVHDDDRLFTGPLRISNMMDVPQEYHISAMGEWADKIPDLDFDSPVIVDPQEQRDTRFAGHLVKSVEEGEYRVDLAIWTPGEDGGRIIILNRTVDMEVMSLSEDLIFAIIRAGIPLLIISCTLLGTAVFLVARRRWHQTHDHNY